MPGTSCPASTRRGTSCLPIAPVAPATNTLIINSFIEDHLHPMRRDGTPGCDTSEQLCTEAGFLARDCGSFVPAARGGVTSYVKPYRLLPLPRSALPRRVPSPGAALCVSAGPAPLLTGERVGLGARYPQAGPHSRRPAKGARSPRRDRRTRSLVLRPRARAR